MSELTLGQKLNEELTYSKKNVYEQCDEEKLEKIMKYAEGYKKYLDAAKTEREAVKVTVELAEVNGYTEYKFGDALKVGDKKYYNNRNKSLYLFKIIFLLYSDNLSRQDTI